MPAFSDGLQKDLDDGRVVLGGCCVSEFDPDWHCNDCGHEFGVRVEALHTQEAVKRNKLRSVIYGAAVGDALGVPYEFSGRDSFSCTGMIGGGVHDQPAGTFSDDTSLLLATCASLKENNKRINIEDMRAKFRSWLYEGAFTPDAFIFDVGNATATALDQGFGCSNEQSNGNGSLMRIAPLAFIHATDNDIRAVSSITHAHWISTEACVAFVHILRNVLDGTSLAKAIETNKPKSKIFDWLHDLKNRPRGDLRSGGFVLDTLAAAFWCALNTTNYRDCVLAAVNLGDDTDTTACVAGAVAGALYGFEDIPEDWIDALRGRNLIDECLF
ncbi:ADP-ribosylglycohydrolase family protein [Anaerotardibacter muris]|uniref:ADP-ribosylglycohydrolase family protein n=1 Tax=Anaerotardibacter muris TaxID=2941505 RepID=UPI002040C291|nr:ADP-ribosylglycohydrolase family protein [Anaerotardibacter muris]